MIIERRSKSTMTPFQLNHGDELHYFRNDGEKIILKLLSTQAFILEKDYGRYLYGNTQGEISAYGFNAELLINGEKTVIHREVGTQKSFYDPVNFAGVHIWLDAVRCIFNTSYDHGPDRGGFLVEKDFLTGHVCMPPADARLVIQDADQSICPEPLYPWFDSVDLNLQIKNCYNGEDCWMGPYGGAFAHCGLDINMPAGSKLFVPVDLETHRYCNSLESGFNNNRWEGFRDWGKGVIWRFYTSHLIDLLQPQYGPVKAGSAYATSAGVATGAHEHTHFNLQIFEQGGSYMLDPWILFRQMLRDRKE